MASQRASNKQGKARRQRDESSEGSAEEEDGVPLESEADEA
jgi:hypothetical protein